jgi:hypothetical protein
MRTWRKNNPEKCKIIEQTRYSKHRDERNKSGKNRLKLKRAELRKKILSHYGGSPPHCQCRGCYYSDHDCPPEFLTIDHINNNGNKERKLFNGQISFYNWIVKNNYPEGYRILCWNCNYAISRNGYCPHNSQPAIENISQEVFTYKKIELDCEKIVDFLRGKIITGIVPIPRGGVIPAVIISHLLNIPLKIEVTSDSDVIIDEIIDSGLTLKSTKQKYPRNLFVSLYFKSKNFKLLRTKPDFYVEEVDKWCVFPWEKP